MYQNDTSITRDTLAQEFGVGSATVARDGKYAESLDTLADTLGDAYRDDILNQNIKATRKDVHKLADIAREAPEKAQAIVTAKVR